MGRSGGGARVETKAKGTKYSSAGAKKFRKMNKKARTKAVIKAIKRKK